MSLKGPRFKSFRAELNELIKGDNLSKAITYAIRDNHFILPLHELVDAFKDPVLRNAAFSDNRGFIIQRLLPVVDADAFSAKVSQLHRSIRPTELFENLYEHFIDNFRNGSPETRQQNAILAVALVEAILESELE